MTTENPYAAPKSVAVKSDGRRQHLYLASAGQRFVNLLIDGTLIYGTFFGIVTLVILGDGEDSVLIRSGLLMRLLAAGLLLAYYIGLEATTGQTIGKLVTRTRVVNLDNGRPSFGQIGGRALCRMIPFEAFSFLGGRAGWHDKIPSTRVVRIR